jgi:hypothetical protein
MDLSGHEIYTTYLILEATPNTKFHVGRVLKQAKGDPDATFVVANVRSTDHRSIWSEVLEAVRAVSGSLRDM